MSQYDVSDRRNARTEVEAVFDASRQQIANSAQWLAGGVSSNFRLGVTPTPLVFDRGEGAYLYDIDGNALIDYYLALGPMILGHNPEPVRRAAMEQLDRGILYGGQSLLEAEVAELFCHLVPCAERVRFTFSARRAILTLAPSFFMAQPAPPPARPRAPPDPFSRHAGHRSAHRAAAGHP